RVGRPAQQLEGQVGHGAVVPAHQDRLAGVLLASPQPVTQAPDAAFALLVVKIGVDGYSELVRQWSDGFLRAGAVVRVVGREDEVGLGNGAAPPGGSREGADQLVRPLLALFGEMDIARFLRFFGVADDQDLSRRLGTAPAGLRSRGSARSAAPAVQ